MRPYNPIVHPRGWRAFMEYGNGIVGDMCIHMLDMVRWMLDLGWPKRISSTGGILVDKASKANISDTQTATFDFGDLTVVWQHRTWGDAGRPEVSLGRDVLRRQGDAQGERHRLRLHPAWAGASRSTATSTYELEQYPEDKTEKDLEKHVAPAIRGHMKDFLAAIATRGKPVADIEQGYISTASCILANLSMQARPDADLGPRGRPRRRRRRGQPAPAAAPIARPGSIPSRGRSDWYRRLSLRQRRRQSAVSKSARGRQAKANPFARTVGSLWAGVPQLVRKPL